MYTFGGFKCKILFCFYSLVSIIREWNDIISSSLSSRHINILFLYKSLLFVIKRLLQSETVSTTFAFVEQHSL